MINILKNPRHTYKPKHSYAIILTLATSIILLTTSLYLQTHINKYSKEQLSNTLKTLRDSTHNAVRSWIELQKNEVKHWAEAPNINTHIKSLTALKIRSPEFLISLSDQKQLRDHMQPLMVSERYLGYFLIGMDNINLASSRDSNIGHINLMANKSGFLDKIRAGETVISSPTKSDVPLYDAEGKLQPNLATMFVGTPVKNESGDIIAVFTLRIDPSQGFSKVFQHTTLSKNTEVYAFNRLGMMISSSRFESQLKNIGMLSEEKSSILNIKLINPGINLFKLHQSVTMTDNMSLTRAAQQAINGNNGVDTDIYPNYRGIDVVGAWLWDKKYDLGIIVEQDATDAFSIYRLTTQAINVLTAISICMLIVVAIIFIKSRKQLQKSEYQQRSIINTVLDAVITIDSDSNILTFNKAAESIFGYSAKEVINKSIDLLMPEIYSIKHKQHISNYCDGDTSSPLKVGKVRGDLSGQRKNGEIFPIEITLNSLVLDNQQAYVGILRDITDRIQNELILKEERDKAQFYLDTVEVIVLMLDPNACIELINRKGCELLGFTQSELVGKCAIELLVPEKDRNANWENFKKVLNGKIDPALNYENKILTKDGELLDIVWKSAFIKDKDGKTQKILTSGIDITQSQKIKNELQQQQLLFESVFEDVPDAMIITNDKYEIIRTNHSFNQIFGYSSHEVYGKPASIVFENQAGFDSCIIASNKLSPERQPTPKSINYRRKNGTNFPGETVSASWRDIDGNIKGCISVIRDVSERFKAEQALKENEVTLQSALDAVEAGAFSYDIASNMILWDKRSCEIFGNELNKGIGEISDWEFILHPDDVRDVDLKLKDYIANSNNYDLRYRIVHPSGEIRHVHTRGIIFRDDDNKAICIKGLNIDDTQEYFANEEKMDLQQQLIQAQKMESIGQLTGGIAHDFNNMLGSIMGFTQLSQKRQAAIDDQKLKSYLDQVLLAGERARDLVKQMLAFSRTEVGKVADINPDLIIDEVISMLRPILPSSIDIEINTEANGTFIKCNAVQLNQILMNLCINARDAMSGKGMISLITRTIKKEDGICTSCHKPVNGNFVSIIVSDTGCGIPEEIKSSIFQPFISTKEVGKGTGMGLAMVHGIVHQHNGHIIVDSTPGEGTTFSLLLPVIENETRDLMPPQQDISSVESNHHLVKKHIMVVDDEISICQLFAEFLIDNGYEISTFIHSEEALKAFEKSPDKFDCLITDQTMPKLTGIELASKISRIRKDFPIVIQTGYSDQINEQIIEDSIVSVLLKKPVDIDEMISTINNILNKEQNKTMLTN